MPRLYLFDIIRLALCVLFISIVNSLGVAQPANLAENPKFAKDIPMTSSSVDLVHSLTLAGDNLMHTLNPELNYLPYWEQMVDENYGSTLSFGWPGHNIGRWWDAMLRLEEATGYAISPAVEAAMLENVMRFYDNPNHMIMSPAGSAGDNFEFHSLREGMLALNALVRYRNNQWAREEGHRMAASLLEKINFQDGSWDLNEVDRDGRPADLLPSWASNNPVLSHGRLIEALVWFYQATQDPTVLDLATRLAEYHFANTTQADGRLNMASGSNHTHSYLGVLRGLLLFGELSGRQEYVDRVNLTLRNYVFPTLLKKSGFMAHDLATDRPGETTSPGDVAQLCTWLADRHSQNDLWDVAERIVRARILPSQITSTPPLTPLCSGEDRCTSLSERIIGAYGGMHREPHGGKHSTFDVTAADVHTLVDVYNHIVTSTDNGLRVNFHFSYDGAQLKINSSRADRLATVRIEVKSETDLQLRVPRWAPRESLTLRVNGETQKLAMADEDYLELGQLKTGNTIELSYGLPVSTEHEVIIFVDYTLLWRGDEVMGVKPNTTFYPFYPDFPANFDPQSRH